MMVSEYGNNMKLNCGWVLPMSLYKTSDKGHAGLLSILKDRRNNTTTKKIE